jgi:hypothetical protein
MSIYYKSIRQKTAKKYTEKQFLKLMKKRDLDCSSYLIGQESKPCKEWDKMQATRLDRPFTRTQTKKYRNSFHNCIHLKKTRQYSYRRCNLNDFMKYSHAKRRKYT